MIIFLYFVSLFICVFGFFSNRDIPFFKFILFFIISYMMGRGAETPDTLNYFYRYLESPNQDFFASYEPGYAIIQKVGNYISLSYSEFRFTVSLISLFLINSFANKFSSKASYGFFLAYLSFYIFIDSEQFRSFFSFSVVLFGLGRILFDEKKINKVYFILSILLASTIHISSLAFLPLYLITFKNQRSINRLVAFFTVLTCMFIFVGGNNLAFIKSILLTVTDGSDRVSQYGESRVRFGFLFPVSLHFLALMFLYFCHCKLKMKNVSLVQLEGNLGDIRKLFKYIVAINLVSFLYFPLYMFNLQFFRLGRSIMLIDIMFFCLLASNFKSISYINKLSWSAIFILCGSLFYYTYIMAGHVDSIIEPFFDIKVVEGRVTYG
ncbi:EpsG family protein [Shewanella sp. SR44-4]|uniref:EpsG family protein n=1 Tax=Shewanella sp. SR44-4 TaxID=2760935 RepID=UPI001602A280|nr:EpsG family protein [Shewanella sp. SR44-4]MBB1363383.1 EpsG family protein [Shewanella sp. SR44-4]